jgi:hypothetical protein
MAPNLFGGCVNAECLALGVIADFEAKLRTGLIRIASYWRGVAPWKEIISAAESAGGVEFYLMKQEGSRFSEFETAERCLAAWKRLRVGSTGSGARSSALFTPPSDSRTLYPMRRDGAQIPITLEGVVS